MVNPQRLDEDGDNNRIYMPMTFNDNNLSSACGKPPKVNPTPSWGGAEVGDYQVLSLNYKNHKQIASCGVPVGDGEDINLDLAISDIDIACINSRLHTQINFNNNNTHA